MAVNLLRRVLSSISISALALASFGSTAGAQIGGAVPEVTAGCTSVDGTSPRARCVTPAQGGVRVNSDPGGYLSGDRRFFLTVQDDENVVLHFFPSGYGNAGPDTILWASRTNRNYWYAMRLEFQSDGNLVAYENNTGYARWSSNTSENPGAKLNVQNDGNVLIRNSAGSPIWSTNTCCH